MFHFVAQPFDACMAAGHGTEEDRQMVSLCFNRLCVLGGSYCLFNKGGGQRSRNSHPPIDDACQIPVSFCLRDSVLFVRLFLLCCFKGLLKNVDKIEDCPVMLRCFVRLFFCELTFHCTAKA